MRTWCHRAAATLLAAAALATPAAASVETCPAAAERAAASGIDAELSQANALAEQGKPDAALERYERIESRSRAAGDLELSLRARANAVRVRIEAGRTDRAQAELDALLAAVEPLPDPVERARLRIHLARSLALLGRTRRAAEVLLQAAGDARGRDRRLESYAQGYLAELYEQAGRRQEAGELVARALFAAERADAPDAVYRWQWLRARLRLAAGDEDGALADYRSAVDTLRRTSELGGPKVEPLYLGFVDLLLRRSAAADGVGQQALLAEARSALEDLKAGELRDYFRDPCLAAQRKAAPDTVPGALVVYPIALPDRLELVVGRAGRLSHYTVDVDRERFTEAARELRRKVEKRTTHEYRSSASALYEWLVRPLDLEGVETLVFVAGGAARALPFAALYDAQARRFLIEKVPVAITPGLTLTEPRRIDTGKVTMLAAGLSESVQGYPALAGVRSEIDDLHDTFDARRLLDADFKTARFEDEMHERVFDVVHVASHGEFLADGSESYLLTYDGRIPMDELGRLVGATRFRERGLELLTLSACRTAAGDDRAALGLAGVALRAGARSALATLWAVNDEVSSELMTDFYAGLRQGDLSRAAALQRAQLHVLYQRAYQHPAYWAAYLLISSWL